MKLTFITGNPGKAEFLARHVKFPIEHKKVDLDEIQSLELKEIAEHKARQAYEILKSPVLVEDVSLVFLALSGLPGPFIKWFELALGLDGLCRLLDGKNRQAIAKVCFAYFDGERMTAFEGEMKGSIAESPRGKNGFGFDPILIRDGQTKTMAEMTDEELEEFSLRTTTVYRELRKFLADIDKA